MGMTKEERRKRQHTLEAILPKARLLELYVEQGISANIIAKAIRKDSNVRLTAGGVIKLLKQYGIPVRGVKEGVAQTHSKELREKTNIARYGSSNPLAKGTVSFEKRNKTVQARYGVSNVRQADEVKCRIKATRIANGTLGDTNPEAISRAFRRRLQDAEWSKEFSKRMAANGTAVWKARGSENRKKWRDQIQAGWDRWWDELGEEARTSRIIAMGGTSKLESDFLDLLKMMCGEDVRQQYKVPQVRGAFDCYIESCNTLVEIQGTFWHADPRVYKADDVLQYGSQSRIARDIWEKDRRKQEAAIDQGYRVICVWEIDIRADDFAQARRVMSHCTAGE